MVNEDLLRDLFRWNDRIVDPDLLLALTDTERLGELIVTPVQGVYTFPFLSRDFCRSLIWLADLIGRYEPSPGDPYPGQELSLVNDVKALREVTEQLFNGWLAPMIQYAYNGYEVDELVDAFVLKYSLDRQTSMGIHFDEQSEVSCAVALNDDFEGGGLTFPDHSSWTTREVPVGHAVVFPGRVTHRHEALPITSGCRYSLTWWTRGKEGSG